MTLAEEIRALQSRYKCPNTALEDAAVLAAQHRAAAEKEADNG
jgi:hypothetical protein